MYCPDGPAAGPALKKNPPCMSLVSRSWLRADCRASPRPRHGETPSARRTRRRVLKTSRRRRRQLPRTTHVHRAGRRHGVLTARGAGPYAKAAARVVPSRPVPCAEPRSRPCRARASAPHGNNRQFAGCRGVGDSVGTGDARCRSLHVRI